ncbi:MAG: caspase family protein, partial [Bacteroidota bacterium]
MRRALLVGIDHYANPKKNLNGCVNDANRMKEVFETHENKDRNFDCKMLVSSKKDNVTRSKLKEHIKMLFNHRDNDTVLLYFSGHGATTDAGTYLVTYDAQPNDEGISLMEIVALANNSKAKEVVIILDCCHAGGAGNSIDLGERKVVLREGISILAAATEDQYSWEKGGYGVFTSIIYNAMLGGAADVRGKINLSSLYYYADTLLNAWKQRPVFKSHVSQMISLRDCKPKIPSPILRKLTTYFEGSKTGMQLSPNFLEDQGADDKGLLEVMSHLRMYHFNGLIYLPDSKTLEEAALYKKPCCLTPLGEYCKK